MFSLRAAVAAHPGTESQGLTEYISVTWSIGFIIIFGDVCSILRCLLVNSTRPDESLPTYALDQLPTISSAPKLVKHSPAVRGPCSRRRQIQRG